MSNLQDMFDDEENVRKFISIGRGRKMSAETRAKISAATKGISKHNEETRANMSASRKGRSHSEETIILMSAQRKGKRHTAEWNANIKQAKIAKQSVTVIAVPGVYKGTGKAGNITIEAGTYHGTQRMIADQLNISVMTLQRRIARGWYKIKENA